jgi:lysophospholipase L1-like esterase
MTDFSITFFGTSIMEHLQAHSAVLDRQYDLPGIGESVVIDSHRRRGWVHLLFLQLQASMPGVRFGFDNQGFGGATSRDVLRVVREAAAGTPGPDLAVLGVGINDVWRCFQNRPEQAVGLAEYRSHYIAVLSELTGWAGQVLCLTETPFGWDDTLDVIPMNKRLSEYNAAAMTTARQHGVPVADLWQPVLAAARQFSLGLSVWSDGAHLSELGDAVVAREVENAVRPLLSHPRYGLPRAAR